MKRAIGALLSFGLLAAMTGCVREPATEADLVGSWINGETVLALSADGTFTLNNAPSYTLFTISDTWAGGNTTTRDGFGDWSIEADAVRLSNQTPPGYGEKIYVGSSNVLYFGLDLGSDSPRCFELVKEGSRATPKGPEDCFLRP